MSAGKDSAVKQATRIEIDSTAAALSLVSFPPPPRPPPRAAARARRHVIKAASGIRDPPGKFEQSLGTLRQLSPNPHSPSSLSSFLHSPLSNRREVAAAQLFLPSSRWTLRASTAVGFPIDQSSAATPITSAVSAPPSQRQRPKKWPSPSACHPHPVDGGRWQRLQLSVMVREEGRRSLQLEEVHSLAESQPLRPADRQKCRYVNTLCSRGRLKLRRPIVAAATAAAAAADLEWGASGIRDQARPPARPRVCVSLSLSECVWGRRRRRLGGPVCIIRRRKGGSPSSSLPCFPPPPWRGWQALLPFSGLMERALLRIRPPTPPGRTPRCGRAPPHRLHVATGAGEWREVGKSGASREVRRAVAPGSSPAPGQIAANEKRSDLQV